MYILQRALITLVCLVAATNATAVVIYESATLGTTGHNGGFSVDDQFLGSRFELSEATQVTSIGGHVGGSGTVWAALFALSDATSALPTFGGADPALHALAFAILDLDLAVGSALVTAGLAGGPTVLGPGSYGIVIGDAGFFGTTGSGVMPTSFSSGATDIGSPTYFFHNGGGVWLNGGFDEVRFEVNGNAIDTPEPATLGLAGLALIGAARARRRFLRG